MQTNIKKLVLMIMCFTQCLFGLFSQEQSETENMKGTTITVKQFKLVEKAYTHMKGYNVDLDQYEIYISENKDRVFITFSIPVIWSIYTEPSDYHITRFEYNAKTGELIEKTGVR